MNKSDTSALLLSTLRAVGGAAFLAPSVAVRKLEVNEDANGEFLYRMFAARNVALIIGVMASRGEARRLWYKAGVVCDALDVAAGLLGHRAGRKRKATAIDTGAAAVATLIGLAALAGEPAQEAQAR
jgi:hypothetical protein